MASDVITNLELDKELKHGSRVIVVKENNNCDGSFITNCVLGHCVKNNQAMLIVSTHHSQVHYQNIGLKMGINLQKNIDNGLLQYIDLGKESVKFLIENNEILLNYFIDKVKSKLSQMWENYNVVNIIFDGVSHLFDLQFSLREINNLCSEIILYVRNHNHKSFLMFYCTMASEDDNTHVMANLLCHKAFTVVEIEHLSSGLSADVSGHLTITHPGKKFDKDHMFELTIRSSRYLFKLFDRGVKFLAPGTV